jgi:phage/plasmid primase-like uncharacterized protein
MTRHDARELAWRLGRQAEAVCRHYLSNGRRHGAWWQVGDVQNTPGRSMFVRLRDCAKGCAGKWVDAAEGSHGDLLDVIRESCGLVNFQDVADEARHFLSLPRVEPRRSSKPVRTSVPAGSAEAAQRLFAMARPIGGTLVETYLRHRGIGGLRDTGRLRFHPRCYYRPEDDGLTETWPAMIAAVTDHAGRITGVHRTWLARDGSGKAPIDTQRKAMGDLLGHAVRFGRLHEVMAVGEGVETMLSLKCVLPGMTAAAALSSAHLGAFLFPAGLRRLYIARDNDPAGEAATSRLIERAKRAEIDAIVLSPRLGDFNDDLTSFGMTALRADIRRQLAPEDAARFRRLLK